MTWAIDILLIVCGFAVGTQVGYTVGSVSVLPTSPAETEPT